ncbi:MAG: hypothetical protein LUF89_08945 [Ruminococcus sp.]|nr:hypothetical protein [Ruminococcus sp.]
MASDEAYLERLLQSGGTNAEYLSLLEETAEAMGVSYTTLQSRPVEVQIMLTKTYVNNWGAGREVLQEELQNITNLSFSAENQLEESQMTRTVEKSTASDDTKRQQERAERERAAEVERQTRQREMHRQARRVLFSQELLRRKAERIRRKSRQKQQEKEEPEITSERTRKN